MELFPSMFLRVEAGGPPTQHGRKRLLSEIRKDRAGEGNTSFLQ